MATKESTAIIKKGIFALAFVAIIGTTTTAYALVNDQNFGGSGETGYGTDGATAVAALDQLIADYNVENDAFQGDVNELAATARTDLAAAGASAQADQFLATFDDATTTYNSRIDQADATFREAVANAANRAETKDSFIDAYNRAKADYFNQLDVAKNDFAAVVSNLGDNANQTKDRFIGGYNSTRDAYGNQLEVIKNEFVSKLR